MTVLFCLFMCQRTPQGGSLAQEHLLLPALTKCSTLARKVHARNPAVAQRHFRGLLQNSFVYYLDVMAVN